MLLAPFAQDSCARSLVAAKLQLELSTLPGDELAAWPWPARNERAPRKQSLNVFRTPVTTTAPTSMPPAQCARANVNVRLRTLPLKLRDVKKHDTTSYFPEDVAR
ncbi:hypothetical protein [Bradyrhizobium sp. WSM1743]|uniref:hypothetical protein n=1 Tax=Bradyrhizobium sp. WSM1743 TaxID=318996 RepID=UPI001AEC016D|nr:hypothetical protein [Bradyrhizobium sp. WSM1743]